ncbi:response regulator [Nonomuraea sp. NPDC050547]|uniref:response regulator n=1 Tax=Nonomuraea sp. NPDC050547 TaxID=3364368 RepID=UPI0037ACE3DA
MIRVLVADDEALIRGALVALLGLEPDLSVVAEADTSTGAVTAAALSRPHIAVLDLEMPPADGLVAAERILREPATDGEPATRIVLVTRHARPGVLRRALAAGVKAFVPKTTPAERLAEIIREVHAGRRYVDPEIAASALTENDCPLTTRELEVLRAARSGHSIDWIAGQVHLAPGTVRNYLSSAMGKIGVSSRHAAARRAWEQGWI